MNRIEIILPEEQIQLAYRLGELRNRKKILFGEKTYAGTHSSLKIHEIGALGEVATAYYLKVPVDQTIFETHGDNGLDLITKELGKVQVKTTTYWDEPLLR